MYVKLSNILKTVDSPVTRSQIVFVNVWTTRIRGMVAVCSVIMTFTLTTVWLVDKANRLLGAAHCYEGAVLTVISDIM